MKCQALNSLNKSEREIIIIIINKKYATDLHGTLRAQQPLGFLITFRCFDMSQHNIILFLF